MLLIGSHVSMSGKKMLVGAVEEAISYDANCLMIYTGAPQNTRRKPIAELNIEAGQELLKNNNMSLNNVIIHAPYIINLGNSIKPDTFKLGVDFLRQEVQRAEAIGAKYIVLHPGSHVGVGSEAGISQIIKGLNEVITPTQKAVICLETMAGKGSECGKTFEEIKSIIDQIIFKDKIGVCFDTCHVHDAGYDIAKDPTGVIDEFDEVVGLEYLKVLHMNDSKNECGSHKDRHENFGYGHIGFDSLMTIINDPRLDSIPKILETPYIDKKFPPYKFEIAMIKNNKFNPNLYNTN